MATPQTVSFHTLGCKLNFSETSTIKRRFEDYGYTSVPWDSPSDIYVLNTCSVTEFADKKCRAEVRKVLRLNDEAKVVIIGCYAQLKPDEIAEIPGVDLVLGAAEKFNVQQYVDGLSKAPNKGLVKAGEISAVTIFDEAYSFGDRTRTFLKVQDGCDYKCSFCTIPQARGKSRSPSISQIVNNAKKIADQGVKEIVLTGVNIGDFGLRSDGVRLSNFIDMPLQSGSDTMLSAMRRRYRTDLYRERVTRIKELMPYCCIGVDVIVGFPGEDEGEFQKTVTFLEELDISYLHVFTYSERAKTSALDLDGVVPMNIRRDRNKVLRELSDQKRAQFYEKHKGTSRQVLLESQDRHGRLTGFTDNYIKVSVPYQDGLEHSTQLVQLGDRVGHLCNAEILAP